MRNISTDLAAHLQQFTTTLCVSWKIKRVDGVILGFTTCTFTFTYDDGTGDGPVVYKASTGIGPSATKESVGTGVDNMAIIGIITSPDLLEVDLFTGVYDRARVRVMFMNYKDFTMGHGVLMAGMFGQITMRDSSFEVEVRSLSQVLSQQVGRTTTPTCMVEFGSVACTITPATTTTTVTSVVDQRIFYVTAFSPTTTNYLFMGYVTFTSGLNAGRSMEVKYCDNSGGAGRIELQEIMPFVIAPGDGIIGTQGCDKLLTTCDSYGNVVNFQGFPYIPGSDVMLRIIAQP